MNVSGSQPSSRSFGEGRQPGIAPSDKPALSPLVLGAQSLQARYAAARVALQRALTALQSREERVARLERELESRSHELKALTRELERASSRLSDSHQNSHRLFGAYCSSLPGKILGGRFEVVQQIGAGTLVF